MTETSDITPWPPLDVARYRALGIWEGRPLGEYVLDAADARPEKVAVVSGDTRLTYADLIARMDEGAERLLSLGIEPGDRVLVQLANDWPFIVFTLACFRAGIVPVMALPAHRSHELTYLAGHSDAVALVVPSVIKDFDHQSLAEQIAQQTPSVRMILVDGPPRGDALDLRHLLRTEGDDGVRARMDDRRPDPDSPACFLLSGGTTGLPKLIVRTHNDYAYNVRATSRVTGVDEKTVYLGTLPASHNFPLACPGVLGALFAGGTSVMLPSPEPTRAFEAIEQEGVTLAAAVPAVAQRWIEYQRERGGAAPASLQVLQVGGSRMPDELAARVKPELGATLQQVFGMAEGLINMTRLDDPEDVIVTTQGRPVSDEDEIRVVDSSGRDVPDGTRGSILTRGPYTPRGYFRAAEHNARAFVDGWYSSGDIVVRRPDGNLVVHGRDKDIINRGGEKISAEEVENIVYRLPSVDLAAAVSMPDPVLGERLCLFVTLLSSEELSLENLREFMTSQGLAAFKLPERLEVVSSLPLTKVGKIDKRALREVIAEKLTAIG
ncbi:(2,3-dihydroxybenzoyl)adenylate synthase [Microbacterium sp. SSM24]|uniref:(2,3-dihydroxybenzoyl)adenylate synthase n=1 Tax=Microbacterium sp. SSM24 TaxID=2991714 RepID=UPI0022262457|nr:AMP-binding protein [Microbacterium sp. SSM24]MCW3492676.1 AMP-binding protein [Microbacterium sp. SSM24]